jgi:hypothetical protein
MNSKTIYVLFAILALMIGAFAIVLWLPDTKEKSNYVLPSMHKASSPMDPTDIDWVEIQRERPESEKGTITFVRDPESKRWRITQPHNYRADGFVVDQLIRNVYDATRDENADKVTDLKRVGLEPPAETITLKKGEGRTVWLKVGDASPGEEGGVLYVLSSDEPNEVMVVKKSELSATLKTLNDFRSKDLLSGSSSDIQAFTIQEGDKGSVELRKTSEDKWVYLKPPYGDAESEGADAVPQKGKPPRSVRSVLTDLSNLRVPDAKDFVADEVSDLARYNLGPKDRVLRLTVSVTDQITKDSAGNTEKKTSQRTLLVGVGKKVGEKSDQYYACLEDEKNIVRIPAESVQPFELLLDKPEALRDRKLVNLGFRQPDAVNVKNSYGEIELRKTPDGKWMLYRGKDDTKASPADEGAVKNLLNLLIPPTKKDLIESFPDPSKRAELGLDKPEATVSIWAEGLAADTKKDEKPKLKEPEKPTVQLIFGAKQGSNVAVERKKAGESGSTIVLVPEALLDKARQGPLAYVDRNLPHFSEGGPFGMPTDVTKLVLERDGKTFEMTREAKAGSPWKFEKPTDMAGRTADTQALDQILGELNRLHAVRVVADKPDPSKLDTDYGLKTPRYRAVVTVTKDGKPKTTEYDFGKEGEEKGDKGVFVKVSGSELVYLVDKNVIDTLQKELQDPTIFHFDASKVTEVKMTGWMDLQKQLGLGDPYVLQLKKSGSEWTAVTPPKFSVDTTKVRQFLEELSHLRAERFVAHQSKPSPDQDLDVARGALKIVLTIEGEKEPAELTVGKQDGDKGYFAVSNRLPGDVLLVRKGLFEGPRSKPAYFQK